MLAWLVLAEPQVELEQEAALEQEAVVELVVVRAALVLLLR